VPGPDENPLEGECTSSVRFGDGPFAEPLLRSGVAEPRNGVAFEALAALLAGVLLIYQPCVAGSIPAPKRDGTLPGRRSTSWKRKCRRGNNSCPSTSGDNS
jgi:hypothetical protein